MEVREIRDLMEDCYIVGGFHENPLDLKSKPPVVKL
jgi:hypothetical protein